MLYIDFDIQNQEKFKTLQKVYAVLFEIKPKEDRRPMELWKTLIPPYAQEFIGRYYQDDLSQESEYRWGFTDIVTYMQFGMEVEFDFLNIEVGTARIGFSAYAYPYGGMDRFLIFLKAYECIPTEAYNGFEVIEFHWEDDFGYSVTEYPEKTALYKATWKSEG